MALPEEMEKKIYEKIIPKLQNCPICGYNHFALDAHLFAFLVIEPEKKNPTGDGLPIVLIRCENCNFMTPFSAKGAGIID